MIRREGGIQILVGCVMSHEYQKRRYACLALSNMALSTTGEIDQVFLSRGLLNRVLKIASRIEAETQREVVSLLRCLSHHPALRRALLDRGIVRVINKVLASHAYSEVVDWCHEILFSMEREVSNTVSSQEDAEQLKRILPLESSITWSTWGSKLDTIFLPVFASLPILQVYFKMLNKYALGQTIFKSCVFSNREAKFAL